MSEPTRQPVLTLRASTSSSARPRSANRSTSTAALVTPRTVTHREQHRETADQPAHSREKAERTLSSDHLLQGQPLVFIAHNGERYQLRQTRLGKLILTK
ncbi:MAG: hemin uptake protein HemP [Burkholderiales bacterium]|nr:hemin uptake protein HemP [Burkholderiales bacterium]TAM48892.1 MAG: hemin uptake protein HemP [Paraburkholderia sp.]